MNGLRELRWRFKRATRRWRLGIAYATGRLTPDQATEIAYDCDCVAGCWSLASLSADSVYEIASERWGEHPELKQLAYEAAHHVWSKWPGDSSTSAMVNSAEDWALDLIQQYADQEGVELHEQAEAAE